MMQRVESALIDDSGSTTPGSDGESRNSNNEDVIHLNHAYDGELLHSSENFERLKLENALLRASIAAHTATSVSKPPTYLRSRLKSLIVPTSHYSALPPKKLEWDLERDRLYAHKLPGFERVLHIFSSQWLGIRAAAGSLPGHKLAIDAHSTLDRNEVRSVIQNCDTAGVTHIVFHGLSPAMAQLISYFSSVGLSSRLYIVYHGNIVQWCYEPERASVLKALEFARTGAIKRIHFMKRDHEVLAPNTYRPILLNMAPIIPTPRSGTSSPFALVPGSSYWLKNLHCNVLGAALSEQIEKVIHFAHGITLPSPFSSKLEHVKHVDRPSTLRLMSLCGITLNVSLAECHPMVSLESEAVGTPCLRNPLFLDAHEEHPYVRLVEVKDTASPVEISRQASTLLSMRRTEIAELIGDYLYKINTTSELRYREFLEL